MTPLPRRPTTLRTPRFSQRSRRRPRSKLTRRFQIEALEDRTLLALLGLAQEGIRPDIASGAITNLSYTHEGDGTNPFHYDARALAITLGDGTRATIRAPSAGGASMTRLDMQLDNTAHFATGIAGADFSVTGKVVIDGKTYDGTLLTAEAREFGDRVMSNTGEFEVRLAVSGGLLTQQPDGQYNTGEELALLIHQPQIGISSFPKTFKLTRTLSGSSDTGTTAEIYMNSEPV